MKMKYLSSDLNYRVWDEIISIIGSIIEINSFEIKKEKYKLLLKSNKFILGFFWDPMNEKMDVAFIPFSYEKFKGTIISKLFEFYKTGETKKVEMGKEYSISLPNNKEYNLAYIVYSLTSNIYKSFLEGDYSESIDFYNWQINNKKFINEKIKEIYN